jgi:hypothetical protein
LHATFRLCYVLVSFTSGLRDDNVRGEDAVATNQVPKKAPMRFESIQQADVPKGRDGKHKQIVELLLSDIAQLEQSAALKIPLSALPDTKENIRSALSRATHLRGIEIATSSDEDFLYVWKPEKNLTGNKKK